MGTFILTVLVVCVSSLCYKEVAGQLPSFSLHPQSAILASGDSTNLTCSASSPTPISYSWLRDGEGVQGVNAPFYVVTIGAGGEGEGQYSCLASNILGVVTSAVARVQHAVIQESFHSTSVNSPHLITVPVGQTSIISCGLYTSVPDTPLSWEIYDEFNNIRLDAVQDKAIVGLSGNLYFQDAGSINNAIYECRAGNRDAGEIVNGFVQVTVEDTGATPSSPTILSRPQSTVVNEGADAFFECIIGGRPLAIVQWNIPSSANSNDIRYSQNNAVLRVRNVGAGDVGEYTCSASGVGDFTATLSLAQSPLMEVPLPSSLVTVVYGSPLTLQCGSNQTGEWAWFFNGQRLADETGPSLEVEAALLGNTGVYQCFITNSAGFASSSAQVEVVTLPVTIAPLPSLQVVFIDSPLRLPCTADGAPPPTYVWTKESVPLSTGLAFDLSPDGALTILNVDRTSGGNYTCVATNSVGGALVGTASTSTVIVAINPTVLTAQPGELFKIQVGTTGSLLCEVSSDPNADIAFSWTKDGEELTIRDRISRVSVSSGTLRITNARQSDAGVYVCIVITRHNDILGPIIETTPTNLTIIEMPVSPVILSVLPQSPTSLEVQWHFPGSTSDLSSYIIEIQPSGAVGWTQVATQSASLTTSATITGLTPYTLYNVRIVAVTTGGVSSDRMSEVVSANTSADLPGGPPLEISAVPPNNTALRIVWEEPAQPNGLITDYCIQYRLLRDQATVGYTTVSVGSGTARTFVIVGLEPLERYEYRLAAKNSAGVGPYSDIQTADTVVPGAVTEPLAGPFHTQIWFIAVMVIVVIIVIATVAVVTLLVSCSVQWSKRNAYSFTDKSKRSIQVHSEQNGELSHEAYRDYSTRNPNPMELQTYINNGADMESGTDHEVDFTDSHSIPHSTPQLSSSSRTGLVPFGPAPRYIEPPSFQEAISRPRAPSVHSMRSSLGEKPPNMYQNEEETDINEDEYIDEPLSNVEVNKGAMVDGSKPGPASRQDSYQTYQVSGGFRSDFSLDSDSIGKPSLVSSSGTEFSHLAGMGGSGYPHLRTSRTATTDHATFV